jgi:hypothetical protein
MRPFRGSSVSEYRSDVLVILVPENRSLFRLFFSSVPEQELYDFGVADVTISVNDLANF